jgi:hypothetical protein
MRQPFEIPVPTAEELESLETLYRPARRLLRSLQTGAAEDPVDHRLECRESCVTVLSPPLGSSAEEGAPGVPPGYAEAARSTGTSIRCSQPPRTSGHSDGCT